MPVNQARYFTAPVLYHSTVRISFIIHYVSLYIRGPTYIYVYMSVDLIEEKSPYSTYFLLFIITLYAHNSIKYCNSTNMNISFKLRISVLSINRFLQRKVNVLYTQNRYATLKGSFIVHCLANK